MLRIDDTARLADLLVLNRVVHAWHLAAFPEVFNTDFESAFQEYFTRSLGNPSVRHFVAYDGDSAVGFTQAEVREIPESPFRRACRIVTINIIVVDAERRRGGIGRRLVERVRHFAREQGIARIELDHWEGNPAAEFFRSVGFRPYRHYLCASSEA